MLSAVSSSAVLGQRYELGVLLGSGQSGEVYGAFDHALCRPVAIKRMRVSQGLDGASCSADFVTETRTLATLKHPHIVEIYDVGVDEHGNLYSVMELVSGTLASEFLLNSQLSLADTLTLLLPVCGALACAHDLGIIHCDLKPANLAVERTPSGRLRGKLLDFSIARRDAHTPTYDCIRGTPGYMAPEQIRGERCDRRSDVWSLAVVAVRCLTGREPFAAATREDLLTRAARGPLPSLREVAPELPAPISLALDRALAHSPDARLGDTRALARSLLAAASLVGCAVPTDPDPVGLPDFSAWQRDLSGTTAVSQARISRGDPPTPRALPHARLAALLALGGGLSLLGVRALSAQYERSPPPRAILVSQPDARDRAPRQSRVEITPLSPGRPAWDAIKLAREAARLPREERRYRTPGPQPDQPAGRYGKRLQANDEHAPTPKLPEPADRPVATDRLELQRNWQW